MSENVPNPSPNADRPEPWAPPTSDSTVETIAWGGGPAVPTAERPRRHWQAPAVIALFLVVALIAAAVGVALGARDSGDVVASPGAPADGVCRTYDSIAALAVSNDSPVVPCSGPHSAQTFAVASTLPEPREDGTWSDFEMQAAAAEPCSEEAAADALDLSIQEYTTTRFTVAFFTPTPEAAGDGARWVRCDLVLTDRGRATTVSGSFADLVEIDGAFARCSGISVGANNNAPTACTDSADLSAVVGATDVEALEGPGDVEEVRERCRDIAVEESGLDNPSWSATIPRNVASDEGGFALCWLRADQWKVDRSAWPLEQLVGGASDSVSV